jgi:hypothetical protein
MALLQSGIDSDPADVADGPYSYLINLGYGSEDQSHYRSDYDKRNKNRSHSQEVR